MQGASRKLILPEAGKKFCAFMEPEISLSCSRMLAIGPYPIPTLPQLYLTFTFTVHKR